jgi:hypothetical protein
VFSEGAEFAFEPSLHIKLRKPTDPETITRAVYMPHGHVDVTVPTLRDPTAVMIRGPGKMSAVAKEGRLTFVAEGERTTAAARVGEMLVGIGRNDWKLLKQGTARTLSPEDPAATPRPILTAPKVTADAKLFIVRGDEEAHVAASWAPLTGAAQFDVTLARTGAAAKVVSHQLVSKSSLAFGELTPGTYTLVVAPIDKQGLTGTVSEACTLRVVGVQTPPGASRSVDGAVIIGRDQRVSLVGADQMEVAYGNSADFMGVPNTLGLAHGSATTIRLRVPGTTEEAVLHLEPQGLRANVHIGPRSATWPLDRVAIDIDLYDTSGRAVPDDTEIDATVTVNLAKVPVSWERSHHTLHATLPAGTPPGPWVVRTEVHDGHGELIGRDHLEVAPVAQRSAAVARR